MTTFRVPDFACENPSVKTQSVSSLTASDCSVTELNRKAIENRHSQAIVTYTGIDFLFGSMLRSPLEFVAIPGQPCWSSTVAGGSLFGNHVRGG